jgi:multidrug efflux pump subunit AcrA (membrane-fusion protein)
MLERARSGFVSKHDQRLADAANKLGLVRSAKANLDRLRVLEKYKRITAPFDGLVTVRATDIGALINAGASGCRNIQAGSFPRLSKLRRRPLTWDREPRACCLLSTTRAAS